MNTESNNRVIFKNIIIKISAIYLVISCLMIIVNFAISRDTVFFKPTNNQKTTDEIKAGSISSKAEAKSYVEGNATMVMAQGLYKKMVDAILDGMDSDEASDEYHNIKYADIAYCEVTSETNDYYVVEVKGTFWIHDIYDNARGKYNLSETVKVYKDKKYEPSGHYTYKNMLFENVKVTK